MYNFFLSYNRKTIMLCKYINFCENTIKMATLQFILFLCLCTFCETSSKSANIKGNGFQRDNSLSSEENNEDPSADVI